MLYIGRISDRTGARANLCVQRGSRRRKSAVIPGAVPSGVTPAHVLSMSEHAMTYKPQASHAQLQPSAMDNGWGAPSTGVPPPLPQPVVYAPGGYYTPAQPPQQHLSTLPRVNSSSLLSVHGMTLSTMSGGTIPLGGPGASSHTHARRMSRPFGQVLPTQPSTTALGPNPNAPEFVPRLRGHV
jgi:hypothetical protein